ncbi:hypothetical protein XENOCAPTIV_017350, partial [Xenoophorus captivus]
KKGRRKARKTDASDLTPNPQKLHNIGEQLQKLNAAIKGMGPVNDLPAVARARSRKEKNKLASRYQMFLTVLLHLLSLGQYSQHHNPEHFHTFSLVLLPRHFKANMPDAFRQYRLA